MIRRTRTPHCGVRNCMYHKYDERIARHLMTVEFYKLAARAFTPAENARLRGMTHGMV